MTTTAFFVSLPLPSQMGSIAIHDGNGNGKNEHHGDQLECSHSDGKCHREQVAFQSSANHPLAESMNYIKFEGM